MATTPPQDAAPAPPSVPVRVWRSWRALSASQKMSAIAALALLVTMFMPWFSQHVILVKNQTSVSLSLTAFDAFSITEAIVLLIALGVLALLFVRGEGRAPGSPASDGAVILVGGGFAALLIVYRMFSAPGGAPGVTTGLQWGLFLALAAAIWLASTGRAMRRTPSGSRERPAQVRDAPVARVEGAGAPLTRDGARSVTFELPDDQYDE